jgi:hypothetical protein
MALRARFTYIRSMVSLTTSNRFTQAAIWVLIMTTLAVKTSSAASAKNFWPSDDELFSKPLIIGASVSADWASLSPGKRLSYRHTDRANVLTIAKSGHPGIDVLRDVTDKKLEGRSIVIGFDLFFWDSGRADATETLTAMRKLVKRTGELGIPLVLGDIPELIPGYQPIRRELNQMIHRACDSEPHCTVIRLDDLHKQVMRDRALTIKGKKYTFRELVPDGLHIGDVAGEFLADHVHEAIRAKK